MFQLSASTQDNY